MTIAVRPDLREAHRLAWQHIVTPGSWWNGAQRVELARTALTAIDDDDPVPPWVGFSATGRLPAGSRAPAVAHDVVYRISRHAATMTADVYRSASARIGELPYVELCAIASTVAAVAHFCRNVGIPVPAFPEVVDGEPTGASPATTSPATLNWVPVAAPADEVAAVVQAYSAVPGEMTNTWRMADAQYMPENEMVDPAWTRRAGGLSRPQMELIAARIAQIRDCFY